MNLDTTKLETIDFGNDMTSVPSVPTNDTQYICGNDKKTYLAIFQIMKNYIKHG